MCASATTRSIMVECLATSSQLQTHDFFTKTCLTTRTTTVLGNVLSYFCCWHSAQAIHKRLCFFFLYYFSTVLSSPWTAGTWSGRLLTRKSLDLHRGTGIRVEWTKSQSEEGRPCLIVVLFHCCTVAVDIRVCLYVSGHIMTMNSHISSSYLSQTCDYVYRHIIAINRTPAPVHHNLASHDTRLPAGTRKSARLSSLCSRRNGARSVP